MTTSTSSKTQRAVRSLLLLPIPSHTLAATSTAGGGEAAHLGATTAGLCHSRDPADGDVTVLHTARGIDVVSARDALYGAGRNVTRRGTTTREVGAHSVPYADDTPPPWLATSAATFRAVGESPAAAAAVRAQRADAIAGAAS
ncbi:hypothetical protein HK405_015906, partial [Cladochytrium tenue]